MSAPGSANPLLLRSAGGYSISRSLRFNSSDSAYLSRTPASAGNQRTFTVAFWCKRGSLGSNQGLFATNNGSFTIKFTTADALFVQILVGSNIAWTTTSVFRDPSAWYHVVVNVDTTQASSANAVKVYVNNSLQTLSFTAFSGSYTQNTNTGFNGTGAQSIGRGWTGAVFEYANLLLADSHSIDGQVLDPTSFGEFDTNGIWQPKAYTGTYGTNGFHLPFSDNSTAAALGTDTSGNGNTWTVNNISVTAGAGNDSLVDVPTNGTETDTGVGGEVRGNYATWNPLAATSGTFSNGNLQLATVLSGYPIYTATQYTPAGTGKWYWEFTLDAQSGTNYTMLGMLPADSSYKMGNNGTPYLFGGLATYIGYNGSNNAASGAATASGTPTATITTGDTVGWAFDAANGTVVIYKNGVSQGTCYTNIRTNIGWALAFSDYDNSSSSTVTVNFGQRPFAYTAPSGFKALCTANLPAPVVTKPSTVMDVKLYTGTGSNQTITGLSFSPDLVWIKGRSAAYNHGLFDQVRGIYNGLYSNLIDSEFSVASTLRAFNTDGFAVGANATFNASSTTYAAFCWDAGSSTVTNTQGSITSSVRANPSAGFSIVTYTGAGASRTFGHGLNVAPQFFLVKRRDTSASWIVWHTALGNSDILRLESTNAKQTISGFWQNTRPTSSLIYLDPDGTVNASGGTYVCYAFAPVVGYSAMGSYVGNESSDGIFQWCGFRPRFLLFKRSSTTSDWVIMDTAINPYNVAQGYLRANTSGAQDTLVGVDILSNGFKFRASGFPNDASTFIWAAFAESPFQYARAR